MFGLLLIGAHLAAPPLFVVEAGLEPRAGLIEVARRAWLELEQTWREVNENNAPEPRRAIRVAPVIDARPSEGGTSRLGRIALRRRVLDDRQLVTLRHEVAHQFLLANCPTATEDRLFHEAFAVATSGEIESWTRGEYLSTPNALRVLRRARTLDTPSARRALARLLAEGGSTSLPVSLARRLRLCAAGARWSEPVTLEELSAPGAGARGSALVVLNRHSGEVLIRRGAAHVAMPFGSTLKPFILAGARGRAPTLPSRSRRPEWMCGDNMPARVEADMALLRSCNGYFLDWGARDAEAVSFGRFGPLLARLGLGRVPQEMSEAIGARPTLALSPWALAQAYRVLAVASPETMKVMTRNADQGTLSGLGATSRALSGIATKTGTVRDPESRPTLGWVVAVTDDLVVVTVVENRAPRSFADQVVGHLERAGALPGQGLVRVQTFGLLPAAHVEANCSGIGVLLDEALTLVGTRFLPLVGHLEQGPAVCLGQPWQIRFPGLETPRPYAGLFSLSPLAPPSRTQGDATRKQARARRGSEFLFATSTARYVSGVLLSEDATIHGEARRALGRVIAHNSSEPRHGERPLCDTTHCQVFQGTRAATAGDEAIFEPVPYSGWLHFARGGSEPWTRTAAATEVEAVLGDAPTGICFFDGRLHYRRTVARGGTLYDEPADLPCDLLRSRLHLPACPERVEQLPGRFRFSGRGQGHGVGLDVEWAKQSGLSAEEILRRSYR